ncbi:MAG: DUF2892 domain-containing protein [Muriicola sp.]|nr:DUF2892 domain-containing protein [Muriicola sp.]NNK11391.1 DUF2892 domain-containing protein [Flavobacteriaceae bacterium]
MKKNMGALDKVIRIIVGLGAAALVYYEVVTGMYSYVLLAITAIFILTSLVGFCPLYGIFGLNTCPAKSK